MHKWKEHSPRFMTHSNVSCVFYVYGDRFFAMKDVKIVENLCKYFFVKNNSGSNPLGQ